MRKTLRLFVALAGIASAAALGSQIAQADGGKECSQINTQQIHPGYRGI